MKWKKPYCKQGFISMAKKFQKGLFSQDIKIIYSKQLRTAYTVCFIDNFCKCISKKSANK